MCSKGKKIYKIQQRCTWGDPSDWQGRYLLDNLETSTATAKNAPHFHLSYNIFHTEDAQCEGGNGTAGSEVATISSLAGCLIGAGLSGTPFSFSAILGGSFIVGPE